MTETSDSVCLTESEVVDHVRGATSVVDAARFERHIDSCAVCRMLVAEAAKSSLTPWSSSRTKSHPPTDGLSPDDTERFSRISSTLSIGAQDGENDPLVGQLVARRFRVQRLLGEGGMGRVYQAFDELLKVRLAMKLILPELARHEAVLRLLYRELVTARRVNHPNVCRVYDIGQEEGLQFITMELVEGLTLDLLFHRAPPSIEMAHVYLLQVAAALEAAHDAGVIHRDLKPANIMVDGRGHVTVMDFGLARDLVADQRSIVRGPVGTPAYWSPEQARGDAVTMASDVYAFGLVALRLLGVRERGARGIAAAPASHRAILARCLADDPEARYASGRTLFAALKAVRPGEEPALEHEDAGPTEPFERKSGRAFRIAAGLTFALACAGAMGIWARSRTQLVEPTPSASIAWMAAPVVPASSAVASPPPPSSVPPTALDAPVAPVAATASARRSVDAGAAPQSGKPRSRGGAPKAAPAALPSDIPVLE